MSFPIATIGLFTDTHYAQLVYSDRHCEDSLDKLSQCVSDFRSFSPDFVVNLGDLIDKGENKAIEIENLRAILQVLDEWPGERHFVIGNHDVATLTKSEFLAHCGADSRHPFCAFSHGDLRCIVLDSNCHQDGSDFAEGEFEWDDAWISDAQIDWLESELSANCGRPVLIFCHGNLDGRLWQGKLDPHVVRNAQRVRRMLSQSDGILAVIQGHYHPGMATVVDGVPFLGLRAMVVGAGASQNAYGILSVFSDGRVELRGSGMQPSVSISSDGVIVS